MNEQDVNKTHSFELADVEKYGSIEKALIVKEIRNMQEYKMRIKRDGWVYYSGEAMAKKFPYMKRRSITKWLSELIADGYLESTVKNKVKYDQTKSYRLTEVVPTLAKMANGKAKVANDNGINGQPIPPLSSLSPSQSKGWSFEKRKAYAIACEQDRALVKRQAGRASASNKGSFGAIGDIVKSRGYVQKSV